MPTTADPTLQFLERFEDPAQWDRVLRGVPIFTPHETTGRDGKPIKVDQARLQKIQANILKKQKQKGVVLRFTDGHTKLVTGPDGGLTVAPQNEQPEILSYGINPRIGTWGPDGAIGLVCDEYVCRGCSARRAQLPYRSPEFYAPGDDIDAVALLQTRPRLDMGMVTYAAPTQPMTLYAHWGDFLFYAMEASTMPDPTMPPDAKAPDDEFSQKCHAAVEHYISTKLPHLHKMHEHYAATLVPEEEETHGAAVPPPAAGEPPAPALPPAPKTHPEPMAANTLPEQYAQVFRAMQAKIAGLETANRRAEYQAELAPLATLYGVDVAAELSLVEHYTRPQFDAYLKREKTKLEAAAQRGNDPTLYATGLVPTGSIPANPNPGGTGSDPALIGTAEELKLTTHYMSETGDNDYDAAQSFARQFKAGEKSARSWNQKNRNGFCAR